MFDENDIENMKLSIDKLKDTKNKYREKISMIDIEIKKKQEILYILEKNKNLDLVIKCIKIIDVDNRISEDEMENIYDGMDKTDYRIDCGWECDRWFDLNKLIIRIINLKNKYKDLNLFLTKITKLMSEDRLPPINSYNLKFVSDKETITFNL